MLGRVCSSDDRRGPAKLAVWAVVTARSRDREESGVREWESETKRKNNRLGRYNTRIPVARDGEKKLRHTKRKEKKKGRKSRTLSRSSSAAAPDRASRVSPHNNIHIIPSVRFALVRERENNNKMFKKKENTHTHTHARTRAVYIRVYIACTYTYIPTYIYQHMLYPRI